MFTHNYRNTRFIGCFVRKCPKDLSHLGGSPDGPRQPCLSSSWTQEQKASSSKLPGHRCQVLGSSAELWLRMLEIFRARETLRARCVCMSSSAFAWPVMVKLTEGSSQRMMANRLRESEEAGKIKSVSFFNTNNFKKGGCGFPSWLCRV